MSGHVQTAWTVCNDSDKIVMIVCLSSVTAPLCQGDPGLCSHDDCLFRDVSRLFYSTP